MVILAYVRNVAFVQKLDGKVKILTLGKRIRARRKELKMSVDELAKSRGRQGQLLCDSEGQ